MSINLNDIQSFKDARVTVMGLGRFERGSGISAARWLLRHGARVTITDLQNEAELAHQVKALQALETEHVPEFVFGEHRAKDFEETDLVIQNPGVPKESEFLALARARNIPIESDVSLFLRFCPFPVCAVTGTRGKSTTTAMIGEMFKRVHARAIIAGNIQHSPLEELDWLLLESAPVPIVLELSSWLIESINHLGRMPDIAVLTNLYEDHLNRYESFQAYRAAKELLFQKMTSQQTAIFNSAQDYVMEIASRTQARKLFFSYNGEKTLVMDVGGEKITLCRADELGASGAHNAENALAASLVAYTAGVPVETIVSVLKSFQGLPYRQEIIRELRGITFVNDTTATSPDGVIAALNRFADGKNIILLAGGASKGTSFGTMAERMKQTCKFAALFNGAATDDLVRELSDGLSVERVSTMSDAVAAAVREAKKGDIVLLSPGAASFGLFKNEFDRGEQFTRAVMALRL